MKPLSCLALLLSLFGSVPVSAWAACNPNIPESTPDAAFDMSATNGTVIHNATGLMWSRWARPGTIMPKPAMVRKVTLAGRLR